MVAVGGNCSGHRSGGLPAAPLSYGMSLSCSGGWSDLPKPHLRQVKASTHLIAGNCNAAVVVLSRVVARLRACRKRMVILSGAAVRRRGTLKQVGGEPLAWYQGIVLAGRKEVMRVGALSFPPG